MRPRRLLTLDSVPAELLEGIGPAASYRCDAPDAVLVPIATVRGPARKLNRESLEYHAALLRSGASIDPVRVYMRRDEALLVDGAHRWRLSLATGFTHLPCECIPRWEAEELGIAVD